MIIKCMSVEYFDLFFFFFFLMNKILMDHNFTFVFVTQNDILFFHIIVLSRTLYYLSNCPGDRIFKRRNMNKCITFWPENCQLVTRYRILCPIYALPFHVYVIAEQDCFYLPSNLICSCIFRLIT